MKKGIEIKEMSVAEMRALVARFGSARQFCIATGFTQTSLNRVLNKGTKPSLLTYAFFHLVQILADEAAGKYRNLPPGTVVFNPQVWKEVEEAAAALNADPEAVVLQAAKTLLNNVLPLSRSGEEVL